MRDRWQKCRRLKREWKILISKPEEKRQFDGQGSKLDNHIKISLENGACKYGTVLWNNRVIHKSLRNFRTRLRNNQERHGRKEHINR
jgi:hypothetical protein